MSTKKNLLIQNLIKKMFEDLSIQKKIYKPTIFGKMPLKKFINFFLKIKLRILKDTF